MKTIGYGFGALLLLSLASLPGCGVGTYHIPKVEPVVMPEPEEDIFADVEASDTDTEEEAEEEEAEKPAAAEPKSSETKDSSAKEPEPADPLE